MTEILISSITQLKLTTLWIATTILLSCCAATLAQSSNVNAPSFQTNKYYVPKPSTTPPTASSTASSTAQTVSASADIFAGPRSASPSARTPQPATTSTIIHSRLSGFSIPFNVDADDDAFVEVHLYMSANQGRTWEFLNRQPTSASEFPFQANGEGEYWFAIKTLDRNRRLLPHGDPQPELRIIVDTTKPKLEMTAAADPAGRIVCRWNASDVYLKPDTLKLQYKPTFAGDSSSSNNSPWQSVTINTPTYAPGGIYVDQLAFWPETDVQTLDLRVAIADQAGNVVSAERRLTVPKPTWRHRTQSTARPTDQPSVDPSRVPPLSSTPPAGNDAQWKTAFYSKLRSPSKSDFAHSKPANKTAARNTVVPRAIFRDNPYANASSTSQTQRPTEKQPNLPKPTSSQRTAMLIGSEPQFAAPPVPAGWTINDGQRDTRPARPAQRAQPTATKPPLQTFERPFSSQRPPSLIFANDQRPPAPPNAAAPSPRPTSGNDIWNSTVKRDANQPQTSVGSTLSPDHRMLPMASDNTTMHRTDFILPNANEIQNAGDQWVSKSSTRFPNQYRGLDNAGLPANANAQLVPAAHGRKTLEPTANASSNGPMHNAGYSPNNRAQPSLNQSPSPSDRFAGAARTSSLPPANIGRASVNGPTKANTQIISSKRFRLNYDINAIDPSGVGKVDLYITQNRGRSWTLWGQDPDNQSPFPVEVRDQGLYGFRVVIHSKDGLVGVGPSSGDDADMWVRVDTQTPLTQITSVPYGRGNEAGRLVINYRVSDDFLTLRPVRLSYSRSPQGPWTIIEDNLRNEGRYLWRVNRAVPDRIFLKIDALDSAGNVGTHRLSQSVDVSGLVPRGTIRGVEPVGR